MNQNFFIIYAELLLLLGVITLINFNILPSKSTLLIWILLTIIPILYFYFIIFSHTDNVPFKDDYLLLESIYKMESASTFSEWNKAFLKQVNQHRFGFERSIMWLIYKVLGNENIKTQIIIGNGFLLGILYLLFKLFEKLNLSFAFFTPLPLLIFNLTYFENATWGIAAIQNTPIIFFALLTIHFLIQTNKISFYVAIIFATITLFTSGNGLAIWLIGVLILIIQNRWKNLGLWVLAMLSLFSFYFMYDYEMIPSDKTNLIKYPFLNLQYVLAFWGNIFFQNILHPDLGRIYWDIGLCISTGIFLTLIMVCLFWKIIKGQFKSISYNSLVLLGGMAFLACTGLMLVLSRPVEIKIIYGGEILSRRYMIFGAVFFSLGYLGYLHLTQKKKLFQNLGLISFIVIGLFLNINSYYTSLTSVYTQQQELKLDGYYWKNHQMLLSFGEKYGEKIGYNHPTYMIDLILKLDSSGIYKLSQTQSLPLVNLIKRSDSKSAKLFEGKIDTLIRHGSIISREIKERILFSGVNKNESQNIEFMAFKSQQNIFLMPAIPTVNSIYECFVSQTLFNSNFEYEIWKAKLPADIYEIWTIERNRDGNYIPLFCSKIIKI